VSSAPPTSTFNWWLLTVPIDERIARARIRYSHHVLVNVCDGTHEAWGAAPLYANAPHRVRALRPVLERVTGSLDLARPAVAREHCARALTGVPDVCNALDGALWELEALRAGSSVASLLGSDRSKVEITEQLFADAALEPETILHVLRRHGTRALKVKVCGDLPVDLRALRRVRSAVGRDVHIRIDANRGYTLQTARRLALELPSLGIAEWEEPAVGDFETIARLRRETGLRVILDESVRTLDDLEQALAAEALDVLNLKLSRLGGITAALEFKRRCERAGVGILLGCNEDIGPAMAAVLHAAAAWQPFETEGLGWVRLGLDLGSPQPTPVDGRVTVGAAPGWGIQVEPRSRPCGRVNPPNPVHMSAWSRRFAARSVAQRQHQRLSNALLRMRRLPARREEDTYWPLANTRTIREVP